METLEVVKKLEAATAHIESLEMKIKMYEDVLIPELRAAAEKAELERARLAGRLNKANMVLDRICTVRASKEIEEDFLFMSDISFARQAEILVQQQIAPKMHEFLDVDVYGGKIYAQMSFVRPERKLKK